MICKNCGEESGKYKICLECYKIKNKNLYKKSKINDNSIKGKLAEAIVEEMFLSMGYRVFRFGMENTLPGFGSRHLPKVGDVANQVRKMPDFVVISPDNQINYIEVKFRRDGIFDINEYYKDKRGYPYENAFVLLVTPRALLTQRASLLKKGKKFMYLHKCEEFETNKKIILKYIEFCKKFFGNC